MQALSFKLIFIIYSQLYINFIIKTDRIGLGFNNTIMHHMISKNNAPIKTLNLILDPYFILHTGKQRTHRSKI